MYDGKETYKELRQFEEKYRKLIAFLCQRASYGREICCREMIQECYLNLLQHMSELEPGMSPQREAAWVYRRCRNTISVFRRKIKDDSFAPITDELVDTVPAMSEVTQLTVDELASCLQGPEKQLFLLMVDGADDEELERVLGVKHRTVVQMRHNIKKKLQKYIEQCREQ